MYVRANTFTADPDKIDDGLRFIKERVLPLTDSAAGNRGLAMSVDRDTGNGSVVSFWDDLESLRASESAIAPLRDEAAAVLGGSLTPQVLETVEQIMPRPPTPGCWNRITVLELEPADVDKTIEVFRTSTAPALEAMEGFCAAMLNVDRAGGRGVAVTIWRDRDALTASRERASGLRQEVTDKAHGTVVSVEEHEIVLSMRHG
ncbi:MAG: antibiotic biosynthesis monooxygenase [Nocardioidaceae bacterium]